ncbi:MAG: alpha/beta hydrolase [Anaerolineales bacterium]|nr:alpha/beta hydrolase [Anaerolineales bacterium]
MKTDTGFIHNGPVRIHYERSGGGLAPIVLCHGITDNGRCLLRLAEHLAGRFEVVFYDARGHGRSDAPSTGYTANDHAGDLAALVDTLGLEDPILYGHSMGARTVVRLAAQQPGLPRALVLEDPVYLLPPTPEQAEAYQQWHRVMPEVLHGWQARSDPERLALAKEQGFKDWREADQVEWAQSKIQVRPQVFEMGDTMTTISADFEHIPCPTLILKADADPDTQAQHEAVVARLPRGEIVHIPGAGHNVRRDNWAATIDHLNRFLALLR